MKRLTVLQLSPTDLGGGAEKVALDLVGLLCERGVDAWLGVDRKLSDDSRVITLPRSDWRQSIAMRAAGRLSTARSEAGMSRFFSRAAHPLRSIGQRIGAHSQSVRTVDNILLSTPRRPDVVHIHNLHGNYIGLDTVRKISDQVPTILTLHDQWSMTGHCAYSFDCTRWKTSCGRCPYPDVYPSVEIDVTRLNRLRKGRTYKRSRLHIASPSQWLLDSVDESVLGRGAVEKRLIPYGVNRSVFKPGFKPEARRVLDLPDHAAVLLTACNKLTTNEFKDWSTFEKALGLIPPGGRPIIALVVGDHGQDRQVGNVKLEFRGMQRDPAVLASYYRAADVFVLPTKADNFPVSILESLACGTPVIASDVGGIPEQIRPLVAALPAAPIKALKAESATGMLVPAQNPTALADVAAALLEDPVLLDRMGTNASADAAMRFDINKQANSYLEWYEELTG